MQFSQLVSLAALAGAFVRAVPTPAGAAAGTNDTVVPQGRFTVRVYRDDNCNTEVDSVSLDINSSQRCLPYTNVRSIFAET